MSIASLLGEDFKHGFEDDMESFYYVILYASVLWLPHKNIENIEKRISRFFDEYEVNDGVVQGGSAKIANLVAGLFHKVWGFESDSLNRLLEGTRLLQQQAAEEKRSKWTPEALHKQWKSTDEEDLPTNDKVDHLLLQSKENERKLKLTMQRSREGSPVHEPHSLDAASRSSSKRSADDAGFEEPSESSKRQRRSNRLVYVSRVSC